MRSFWHSDSGIMNACSLLKMIIRSFENIDNSLICFIFGNDFYSGREKCNFFLLCKCKEAFSVDSEETDKLCFCVSLSWMLHQFWWDFINLFCFLSTNMYIVKQNRTVCFDILLEWRLVLDMWITMCFFKLHTESCFYTFLLNYIFTSHLWNLQFWCSLLILPFWVFLFNLSFLDFFIKISFLNFHLKRNKLPDLLSWHLEQCSQIPKAYVLEYWSWYSS